MKTPLSLALAAALVGCAGAQTEFSNAGIGPIDGVVDCAADAISDEGFVVSERDDAGILNAENGGDWLRVRVIPGDLDAYLVEVETNDSDRARDAAQEIVTECGN